MRPHVVTDVAASVSETPRHANFVAMTGVPSHVPSVQPLRPPAEPPPSRGDLRAVLAAQYLAGSGIEIGALHSPLHLPEGARARYRSTASPSQSCDASTPPWLIWILSRSMSLMTARSSSTIADRLAGLHRGVTLPRALRRPDRDDRESPGGKLAPGGVLFYVVPDKRYTFYVNRPVTSSSR